MKFQKFLCIAVTLFCFTAIAGPSDPVVASRAESLQNIWRTNAGQSIDFKQFTVKDSQGRTTQTRGLRIKVGFPASGDLGLLSVEVAGESRTLFRDQYAAVPKRNDSLWLEFTGARDGADFEVSVSAYGDVVVRLWQGFGRIEERHALLDYRHSVSEANGHMSGATLSCVAEDQGFSESTCQIQPRDRFESDGWCTELLRRR